MIKKVVSLQIRITYLFFTIATIQEPLSLFEILSSTILLKFSVVPLDFRRLCGWYDAADNFSSNFFLIISVFFFLRFYFFKREGKGGRKRRGTSIGCLLHTPNLGTGLQPRHVRWSGVELGTLQFTGPQSTHWATPARATWHEKFRFSSLGKFWFL